MKMLQLMFFVKNFISTVSLSNISTDEICVKFEKKVNGLSDIEFANLLLFSGFIPDLYANDSSEETLYSKLVEVLIYIWAKRVNITCNYVKQKASYEDVNMDINGKSIVCDVKCFRLGRSQKAPNVKDFIKLEDIRKWLNRYNNKLGGLVIYPDTHEWSSGSDAYQYCTTKEVPTLMLPYKYLSLILSYKDNFDYIELLRLWNYDKFFPKPLTKAEKNKEKYWTTINSVIQNILNIGKTPFSHYMHECDKLVRIFIRMNLYILTKIKREKISNITNEINACDVDIIKKHYIDYKVTSETRQIGELMNRIETFRLK